MNNVQACISTREGYKMCMGENGLYGSNVKIVTTNEIYKMSDSYYFVSEAKSFQPLTVVIGQVVTEYLKKKRG
jgi:hypothetical protein